MSLRDAGVYNRAFGTCELHPILFHSSGACFCTAVSSTLISQCELMKVALVPVLVDLSVNRCVLLRCAKGSKQPVVRSSFRSRRPVAASRLTGDRAAIALAQKTTAEFEGFD